MGDSCSGFQHSKRSVYVSWSVEIRFRVYGLLLSKKEYFVQACEGSSVRLNNTNKRRMWLVRKERVVIEA